MSDSTLSQAEIDALLAAQGGTGGPDGPQSVGGEAGSGEAAPAVGTAAGLSAVPGVAAGAHGRLAAAASSALAEAWEQAGRLLGTAAQADPPAVAAGGWQDWVDTGAVPVLWGRMALAGEGPAWLAISAPVAAAMVGHMHGTEPPGVWDADATGTLAEALGQVCGKAVARLFADSGTNLIPGPVTVEPPGSPGPGDDEPRLLLRQTVRIGEAAGLLALLLPMARGLGAAENPPALPPAAGAAPLPHSATAPPARPAASPAARDLPAGGDTGTGGHPAAAVSYAPARFAELGDGVPGAPRNIELLLDVALQVTVELGRTRRQIREVLALGPGSVIELDRLAGEPVDVLVNGKPIARGEVVVIDEHFGVRITDIISPVERAQTLH